MQSQQGRGRAGDGAKGYGRGEADGGGGKGYGRYWGDYPPNFLRHTGRHVRDMVAQMSTSSRRLRDLFTPQSAVEDGKLSTAPRMFLFFCDRNVGGGSR